MQFQRILLALGIVAAVSFGVFAVLAGVGQAGTLVKFTVNDSGDDGDAIPGDGVCDTVTGPPVNCTFRAGIEESNALNGANSLNFSATNTTVTAVAPASRMWYPEIEMGLYVGACSVHHSNMSMMHRNAGSGGKTHAC